MRSTVLRGDAQEVAHQRRNLHRDAQSQNDVLLVCAWDQRGGKSSPQFGAFFISIREGFETLGGLIERPLLVRQFKKRQRIPCGRLAHRLIRPAQNPTRSKCCIGAIQPPDTANASGKTQKSRALRSARLSPFGRVPLSMRSSRLTTGLRPKIARKIEPLWICRNGSVPYSPWAS